MIVVRVVVQVVCGYGGGGGVVVVGGGGGVLGAIVVVRVVVVEIEVRVLLGRGVVLLDLQGVFRRH